MPLLRYYMRGYYTSTWQMTLQSGRTAEPGVRSSRLILGLDKQKYAVYTFPFLMYFCDIVSTMHSSVKHIQPKWSTFKLWSKASKHCSKS